mgnify:CR=1 FL=1
MYSDYSLWDTFRALHPLLIFLSPDKVNEMIEGLLNSYDEGGWIPKWPSPGYSNIMHGTHGDAVIADAYIKGLRGYDVEKAMEPLYTTGGEERSGLGFSVMESFTDRLTVTSRKDKGTTVVMIKKIRSKYGCK